MANKLTFANGNVSLKNITEYPNSFKRQGAFPLERFSVFGTKAALEDYAKNNPVAYVGQILALVDDTSSSVTIYSIQDATGNLAEVGKATAGDEKGIHLDADNGELSLKNWGKSYWEEKTETVDGVETTTWVEVVVDGTHPWIEGLVPKVAAVDGGFELRWYVPSTKDVEGLTQNITDIKKDIGDINDRLPNYVDLTNAQSISGKKTFTVLPESSVVPAADAQFVNKKYVDDKDTEYDALALHKAEDEQVTGKKTFTVLPETTLDPTADAQFTRKIYVDTKVKDAITGLGTVMHLAHVYTQDEFDALAGAVPAKWETNGPESKAGDVVLVKFKIAADTDADDYKTDATKEYVVVNDNGTLRFEFLGEAHGVTALDSRVTTIEDKLNDRNDGETTVKGLISRVGTAETDISNLKTTTSNLSTNLGTTADTKDKTSAFGRIAKADADITANKNDIANIKKDLDTASTGIKARLTAVEGKASSNATDIGEINSEIGADGTANTVKGRIKTLEDEINDTNSGETIVKGLKSKVADNATAISTINTKLGNVEAGAQVNKIESIITSGTGLNSTIDGKQVTITISKVAEATNADVAKKLANKISVFGKSFEGAAGESITTSDVVATNTALGFVKGGPTETNGTAKVGSVSIDSTGAMTVAKVASATTADTATKVSKALTFGSKTFDGHEAQEITLADLGFDDTKYATKAQGAKADTAVQTIKIGTAEVGAFNVANGAATITAANARTALELGSAALKAETEFAKASDLTILDENVVKKNTNSSITGKKTFTVLPESTVTPTTDNQFTTKKYVDGELSKKLAAGDAMTFKGLVGKNAEGNKVSGATVADLPTENVSNGDTYKVISTGTYANTNAKVGDMFIAVVTNSDSGTTINWTYIPSGDDGNISRLETFSQWQIVIAADENSIMTLKPTSDNDIIRSINGKPVWSKEKIATIKAENNSINITDDDDHNYSISVKNVNTDLLSQTQDTYIILDGGSSIVNVN